MVKNGHGESPAEIRPVRFDPPTPETGDIEVLSLDRMRIRGGPAEFLTSQRLDFDLLIRIDDGHAVHAVDFTDYDLGPGDVLWVRAGQVHRWGRIDDINGPSVLFTPHVIDERTRSLLKSAGAYDRNHWPAAEVEGSAVDEAWALLRAYGRLGAKPDSGDLRDAAVGHALLSLLSQLALLQPRDKAARTANHNAYVWFRDEIDRRFATWHQVNQYADRLGYSPRTLNRLARSHTGLSAKQLVDERIVLEAKRLLSHENSPVAAIADQLGFDDPSNFSSYFLRRTGSTPGAFRG